MERQERIGLVVDLYYNRDARKVSKLGDVHYHSRRAKYMVLYVNLEDVDDTIAYLSRQKFVKSVRPSCIKTVNHNFVGNLQNFD